MKIALFTPAIKTSAIGRMARLVAGELARQGHHVVVIRSEDEEFLGNETHNFGLELVAWNDRGSVESALSDADAALYQIGDNYAFHRGCLEWLVKYPGIVCLHDFFLGNLFCGWSQHRRDEATEVLKRWYGAGADGSFFEASSRTSFIEETREASPMTEWVCSMALGVITHSAWGIERVSTSCPGPVRIVPLAYDVGGTTARPGCEPGNNGSLRILTVGHINTNKRAASVIRAIGGSETLRDHVAYQLTGPIQDTVADDLKTLASSHGVQLSITGQVDDKTLARAFNEADIVSCLRWPSLEAASASAIEAMLYGKVVIVTDTGFYRELPDDCVIKIRPENEIEDLRLSLERLCTDNSERTALGERARTWSADTFTADNYARQIVEAIHATARAKPVLDAVRYFANLLSSWGGFDACNDQTLAPLELFQRQ